MTTLKKAVTSWKVIHVVENRLVSNRRCRRLSEENKTFHLIKLPHFTVGRSKEGGIGEAKNAVCPIKDR